MESSNLFSHTRPDGSDWYTVDENIMKGENFAFGFSSAERVVDAWMNSESHRANMLDEDFKTIGIAVYDAQGINYFALEFGF